MKALFVTLLTVFSFSARADIITCYFTEPFLTVQYSMTQSSVTVTDYGYTPAKKSVIKNVSLQIMGPGEFELWNKNNKVIAKLSLDGQGSDGMGPTVYPYSAEWDGQLATYGKLYGGCTSNFQHSHMGAP